MKLSDLEHASQSIKARNPQLFGVGQVPDPVSQREDRAPLVKKTSRTHRGIYRHQVRITIVSFRRRLLDSDNLIAGAKQLRDVIAEMLGSSDAESAGIDWEYAQILTRGEEGTLMRIEHL